jgi:amidase
MKNWTIEALSHAYRDKSTTIKEVAQQYVDTIMEEDPTGPNAVITLNPFWKEDAAELQNTLFSDSPILHGVPVLIKDNIDTRNMGNSAGSIALKDVPVESDAPLIKQLKSAGALIIGKTNLSEWANFRSTDSVSGWSSLGGQTQNARSAIHNPSGSSSGSAAGVAANYCVFAIGTETDGSIVSPASHNGIVGLKPTVGRVSRTGIIPIAWSQDTAGPMTKSVKDAAFVLDVMCAEDAHDPVTQTQPSIDHSFSTYCESTFIKGKRIGVLRPDESFPTNVGDEFHAIVECLMNQGAQCIELDSVPSMVTLQDHEITQMCCEFPEALEAYLSSRRPASPFKNLQDFSDFNLANAKDVMPLFKQEWFDKCLTMPPTTSPSYKEAQRHIELFRNDLHELWFKAHDLDAMVCATNGPAWRTDRKYKDKYTGGSSHIAAVSGWPSITVPFVEIEQTSLGAMFVSKPWQEDTLLGIAYGFEQGLISNT